MIRKIYKPIIKINIKDPTSVENWAEEINRASQNSLAIESMRSKKKQTMPREEDITPEIYIEKIRQKTDSVDVVMNEKESRQDTSSEEKERQKRKKGKEVTDIEVINAKMEMTTLNEIEEVKTKATEASSQQQNYKDIIIAVRNKDDTREIEETQDTVHKKKETGFSEAQLEQSIWLTSNRSCNSKATYAAKISAYNV